MLTLRAKWNKSLLRVITAKDKCFTLGCCSSFYHMTCYEPAITIYFHTFHHTLDIASACDIL